MKIYSLFFDFLPKYFFDYNNLKNTFLLMALYCHS